jgi:hypothetical protein
MELFKKNYDGESIVDLGRDIYEAFDDKFNKKASLIPSDEYGFHLGEFVVTINWIPDTDV